jgi:catechol 2,3-dioxygenase-like lactoylglutathione lyase family enzyme
MKCHPMIAVKDVEGSSRWYQELLELTSAHGGGEFEMLMAGDELALMLHHLDFEEHQAITDPREGGAGRGVLLYFSVDEVVPYFERAQAMGADVIDEPHENAKAHAIEFSVRDPDGYALTVSQWAG